MRRRMKKNQSRLWAIMASFALLVVMSCSSSGDGGGSQQITEKEAVGTLDETFGNHGFVVTDIANVEIKGMVIQADGKTVVVGRTNSTSTNYAFIAVRYDTNGNLDTTFGSSLSGIATASSGTRYHYAKAAAIQSDGKILVAGYSSAGYSNDANDFTVARFNTNGTLDTSFGPNNEGIITTPTSTLADYAYAIAVQPDGKIVVGGFCDTNATMSSNYDYVLVRYNSNGTLDSTFGPNHDGIVVTSNGSNYEYGYALAIQPDGKILLAGSEVLRYNSDGTLDTNTDADPSTWFGSLKGGIADPSLGGNANAIAVQNDGKIVLASSAYVGTNNYDIVVARLNTDGTMDTSFGTGYGQVKTAVSSSYDYATDIVIQSNGRIVVGGYSIIATALNGDYGVLLRYNDDGTLDTSFNDDGLMLVGGTAWNEHMFGVGIQQDGKIVLAGERDGDAVFVARIE